MVEGKSKKEQLFYVLSREPGSKFPRKRPGSFYSLFQYSNAIIKGKDLTLKVKNEFVADQLEREVFTSMISDAVVVVGLKNYKVEVDKNVGENPLISELMQKIPQKDYELPLTPPSEQVKEQKMKIEGSPLNKNRTFDTFYVSDNNEDAHNIARIIVDKVRLPDQINKIFFINSGVGLGKTHLLEAICWEMIKKEDGRKAKYFTSNDFLNFVTEPYREKVPNASHIVNEKIERIKSLDIFLMDDIQILGERKDPRFTLEKWREIMEGLLSKHCWVCFASDRPLDKLVNMLPDRIYSRIRQGYVEKITEPTDETKLTVFYKKLQSSGIVPSNMIEKAEQNESITTIIMDTLKAEVDYRAIEQLVATTTIPYVLAEYERKEMPCLEEAIKAASERYKVAINSNGTVESITNNILKWGAACCERGVADFLNGQDEFSIAMKSLCALFNKYYAVDINGKKMSDNAIIKLYKFERGYGQMNGLKKADRLLKKYGLDLKHSIDPGQSWRHQFINCANTIIIKTQEKYAKHGPLFGGSE